METKTGYVSERDEVFNLSQSNHVTQEEILIQTPLTQMWGRGLSIMSNSDIATEEEALLGVFFVRVLPFSPHLLIGLSHMSGNNLEKDVKLKKMNK